MVSFFDDQSQVVTEVNDAKIVLQGVIYEAQVACPSCGKKIHLDRATVAGGRLDLSPQLGLCLIPQDAVSNNQGEALRRMLEANLRMPVLLLTDNVSMVRLRPIHEGEAQRILDGEGDGYAKVVAFPGRGGAQEQASGQGIRAPDRNGPAADLGPQGPDEGDQGSVGSAQGEPRDGAAGGSDADDQEPAETLLRPKG